MRTDLLTDTVVSGQSPDTVHFSADTAVSLAEIFGPDAVPADGCSAVQDISSALYTVSSSVPFSVTVIIAFLSYVTLFFYYRPHVLSVLNIVRGKLYIDKLLDEQNYVFENFIKMIIGLLFLATGLAVTRSVEPFILPFPFLPAFLASLTPWIIALAAFVVWMFQELTLNAAGALTLSSQFTTSIGKLRRLIYSFATLVIIPVILLYALAPAGSTFALSAVLWFLAALFFIFLSYRTYLFFVGQKISILFWFLYLCGVEIFPVSLLTLLALKGYGN